MSTKPVVQAVREYFLACPLLEKDSPLGIDNLSETVSYSVYQLPSDGEGVIRSYIDGSRLVGFNFVFASRFPFSETTAIMIENSGFYERLMSWIKTQNINGNLPEVEGAIEIKGLQTSYLFMVDPDNRNGEYQIQLQLVYKRERDNDNILSI